MADQFNTLDQPRLITPGSLRPTGVLAESITREQAGSSVGPLTSQSQLFQLIYLPAGLPVSSLTWASGSTAAVSPTNQWFGLYDVNLNKLAITADDTTTAWGANTAKTLSFATPYIPTASGLYYATVMMKAGTPINIVGFAPTNNVLVNLTPIVCGRDAANNTLTDPASAPATAAALTTMNMSAYVHVK